MLVEDLTDMRRREQEIKVKDATIREVHHRVKNNLQTIASLLRIQARRSSAARRAAPLGEAVERVSSMAVVHEQLTGSDDERVDFADSARTVVEMVRQRAGRRRVAHRRSRVERLDGRCPRADGDLAGAASPPNSSTTPSSTASRRAAPGPCRRRPATLDRRDQARGPRRRPGPAGRLRPGDVREPGAGHRAGPSSKMT